jgi:hypothetical protein
MMHKFKRIVSVKVVSEGTLSLDFDDGVTRIVDLKPIMFGSMFEALKDQCYFEKVCLDEEVGTVVWPNGADFDPDTLYDWEQNRRALSRQLSAT